MARRRRRKFGLKILPALSMVFGYAWRHTDGQDWLWRYQLQCSYPSAGRWPTLLHSQVTHKSCLAPRHKGASPVLGKTTESYLTSTPVLTMGAYPHTPLEFPNLLWKIQKFPFLDCSKSSIFGIRKILHFTFYVKFTT
jgi:hypothetical protein